MKTRTIVKKPKPHYSASTRDLAKQALVLRRLLWLKVMASATPEIKEMLLAETGLMHLYEDIIEATGPREFYPSPEVAHEELVEQVQKAEWLVLGVDLERAFHMEP